ncbi:MAG: hypothetical protein FWC12_05750 [Treponema sp.]|nr:hypothetical protein [Treponema sp.]
MRKMLKMIAVTVFIAVIGFSLAACGGNGDDLQNGALITISGSFAAQNADSGNAKFYASESANRSAREIIAADEILLEGFLEDGPITFKLKGSYDRGTKIYVLSAAGSFLRYSISGNLSNINDSKAIVQVKDTDGNWTSIEVDVDASLTGDAPSINSGGTIQDELDNGIPENMWGIWWGSKPIVRSSETDIAYPGHYYYVVDAYTIILYVDRRGVWNQESYTCYFDGVSKAQDGTVTGTAIFSYTDDKLINQTHPNWWIQMVADYALAQQDGGAAEYNEVLSVINDNTLWGDSEWYANTDKWATGAEHSGFSSQRWNQLFNYQGSPYNYMQFKKDAYKLQDTKLQIGIFYKEAGDETYFADTAEGVSTFNDLRWDGNTFSKARGIPSTPPAETDLGPFDAYAIPNLQSGDLNITSPIDYTVVNLPNEGRHFVMKVDKPNPDEGGWAVALYPLSVTNSWFGDGFPDLRGKVVSISFGADVKRVGADGMLVWQITNSDNPFVGASIPNAKENVWYSMSGQWTGMIEEPIYNSDNDRFDRYLSLSSWYNNSDETTYYIDNFWVYISVYENYDLGKNLTWINYWGLSDSPDHQRGWTISNEYRRLIGEGKITEFGLALYLDDIVNHDGWEGLNSVGIWLNSDGCDQILDIIDKEAFPWDGAISRVDLIESVNNGGYGAYYTTNWEERRVVYIYYDLTRHPRYESFKASMATAQWAEIAIDVYKAWEGNKSLPIEWAFFLNPDSQN